MSHSTTIDREVLTRLLRESAGVEEGVDLDGDIRPALEILVSVNRKSIRQQNNEVRHSKILGPPAGWRPWRARPTASSSTPRRRRCRCWSTPSAWR